jgi:hypothetical protein
MLTRNRRTSTTTTIDSSSDGSWTSPGCCAPSVGPFCSSTRLALCALDFSCLKKTITN